MAQPTYRHREEVQRRVVGDNSDLRALIFIGYAVKVLHDGTGCSSNHTFDTDYQSFCDYFPHKKRSPD